MREIMVSITYSLAMHHIISIIVDAKVLQIKERDEKTNIELKERQYYIHFLNFEKRMDKWIPQSIINKNFGKSQNGIIDGVRNCYL